MSNQTEWQKWCEDTAPVMAAAGRGEVVQLLVDGEWEEKEVGSSFYTESKYRIKPRTIRIGEYDVPEPMREAPDVDSTYWVADAMRGNFSRVYTWKGDGVDMFFLSRGICHSTQEAAALHAKALISLMANKD